MNQHRFSKSLSDLADVPKSVYEYDVIDRIGEGAGSVIYAVSHRESNQIYALKHVVCTTDKHVRFVEQLEAEYEVSRQFSHRSLRRAIDLKINRTFLRKITDAYMVMELFDGLPLEVNLPRKLHRIVEVFVRVAKGLEALHKLGYVHCDLKPNNILLNSHREVKVIDFGQACPVGTVKKRIQGTPDFISPEQVRCEAVTPQTDVFNFGATMYWALCGKKLPTLFTLKKGANSFLVTDHIPTPAALNPEVPEALSNLVMECARTNPAKRPADMGELKSRLSIIHHGITRELKKHAHSAA